MKANNPLHNSTISEIEHFHNLSDFTTVHTCTRAHYLSIAEKLCTMYSVFIAEVKSNFVKITIEKI